LKTQQDLPMAAMRAGKRAERREVQKHIDFTAKGLSESNFRAAAFIRGKKRRTTPVRLIYACVGLRKIFADEIINSHESL
jgi:hypothetical protein